jgi:hypothetical protein
MRGRQTQPLCRCIPCHFTLLAGLPSGDGVVFGITNLFVFFFLSFRIRLIVL